MLGTFHPPGYVHEIGGDPPHRHKQPAPFFQPVITWGRLLTLRTFAADAAVRLYEDFDRPQPAFAVLPQPDVRVDETHKRLHPIQDGLKLELNSWSPRSKVGVLTNSRLIEPPEISYSFPRLRLSSVHPPVGVALEVAPPKIPG